MHRMLDVAFDEDRTKNRKDHGTENLAIVRKLALNILNRAHPGIFVRRRRDRSARSNETLQIHHRPNAITPTVGAAALDPECYNCSRGLRKPAALRENQAHDAIYRAADQ